MTMPDWNTPAGGPESSRRRSQRVILSVAVTVSGQTGAAKTPFTEETKTLVVNMHGALVSLTAKVEKGHTVALTNRATRETQNCKVMYLGPVSEGKTQVGLEFIQPAPEFWHIAFPVEQQPALSSQAAGPALQGLTKTSR
jgi:hypothetical protein